MAEVKNPSTEGYDPEWLAVEKTLGGRSCLAGTAQDLLDQFAGLGMVLSQLTYPAPDEKVVAVQTRDEKIDDNITVRIYTPKEGTEGAKLPLGVYYHAGGFLLGNLDSDHAMCLYLAAHSPSIIVSVDYRLGPTYKLPVMIEDGITAYSWALENAAKLGADLLNVYTVGTSAGGGIALAVANHLIKAGKRSSIKGIAAFVPVTVHPSYGVPSKYKEKYTSYKENATGVPLIDAGTMDTFFKSVDCKPDCAITFALLSDVLAEFPKTYIATCGKDPLRDDGAVLELMLKEAGATAKRDHYPGFPHVFWILPGMETAAKFLDNAVQGIKYVLSD